MAATEPAPERRLTPRGGELISAVSALVLLVAMFALKWFGLVVTPGPHAARSATPSAENAWHGLLVVRWVMALTIFVALGSVVLHATQRSHGARTDTSVAIAMLGSLTTVLLIYRVLINLPSPRSVVDEKLGAYLGLLAAVGVAIGGYESIREKRMSPHEVVPRSRSPVSSDVGAP